MSDKTITTLIFSATGVAGASIGVSLESALGIALTSINIIYLVVMIGFKIYAKIKEAKKDGEISAEEAQDIANTIQQGLDDIKKVEDKKNGKK